MPRVRFRRILPVVQLALFLALVWVGKEEEKAFYAELDARDSALTERAKQILNAEKHAQGYEAVEWDPRSFVHRHVPPAWEVCFAINAPAGLMVAAFAIGLEWLPEAEWALLGLMALGVVVLWYLVGVRLDRFYGLPPARQTPTVFSKLMGWASLIAFATIATLSCIWFFRMHPFNRWPALSLAIWCGLAALSQVLRILRWRATATTQESNVIPPSRR